MSSPGPAPFLDQNNPLLAGAPARLDTGVLGLPAGAGTAGVVTIRTASTTLTVLMSAADLDTWAGEFRKLAATVRDAPVLDRTPVAGISALRIRDGRPGMA